MPQSSAANFKLGHYPKALYIARGMHVLHLHQIGGGRRLQRRTECSKNPFEPVTVNC